MKMTVTCGTLSALWQEQERRGIIFEPLNYQKMTARTWTSPRRIVMGERPARMTAPSVYPRSWQSCRCTSVSWHLASLTEKPCWVAGANCRQIKPRSSRLVTSRIHTSSRRDALSDTRRLTRAYTDSHTHSFLFLRVVIIHGNRLLAYCRQISNVTLPMFYFKVSTVKRIDIWHIYAVWTDIFNLCLTGGNA